MEKRAGTTIPGQRQEHTSAFIPHGTLYRQAKLTTWEQMLWSIKRFCQESDTRHE